MEGKHAPPAEGTDDKTKSIAPRTSVTPVHCVTRSEFVKSGIADESIDMRGKGNTDSLSVSDAKPSNAAASRFVFQQRKNKKKRKIITGYSVSCKGVALAPEPIAIRHLFIKWITKDTENDAVQKRIQNDPNLWFWHQKLTMYILLRGMFQVFQTVSTSITI